MVIVSPLSGVIPLPNGLNGLQMVVTNYLLSGMILQVSRDIQTSQMGSWLKGNKNHALQGSKLETLSPFIRQASHAVPRPLRNLMCGKQHVFPEI